MLFVAELVNRFVMVREIGFENNNNDDSRSDAVVTTGKITSENYYKYLSAI
jgi:hypothetical protein